MDIQLAQLQPWAWALVGAGLLLVTAILIVVWRRRLRRSGDLKERFGPEYHRVMDTAGSRRLAETELERRVELRDRIDIRPLAAPVRRRYVDSWQGIQLQFVDSPVEAVRDAGHLVDRLMEERGYVFNEFEQRAAAFSVDYPHLTDRYREASAMSLDPDEHPPRTEELRQTFLDYRLMLEELIDSPSFRDGRLEDIEVEAPHEEEERVTS